MLIWLVNLGSLDGSPGWDKITLRAAAAAVASFVVGVVLGGRMIAWLEKRFREPNCSPSPQIEQLHRPKDRTPTMGGLFLVLAILASAVLLADLSNPFVLVSIFAVVGLTLVGVVDDLTKMSRRGRGISAIAKLIAQVAVAGVTAIALYQLHRQTPGGLSLHAPLVGITIELGAWYAPLAVLVIVGASNAVNLTDGLDGLAGGCLVFATAGMGVVAYVAGHRELADYLGVLYIAGSGEMVVLAGGMVGALLGFLWFNCHPAQVFMGDAGSLPLGGMLAVLALVARQELALAVVGGVFVAEAISVIVQVGYYKLRRRRIFLCAPLHHHFQFLGWPESRIVVRFWIAAALCSILGLASLKYSAREHVASPGPVASTKVR